MYYTQSKLLTLKSEISTERSLPEALAAGDERAISKFYESSGPVLFTVCRRYASSQEQAEDMFQEGFMHILAQVKKFGGQSSLQTWCYRVMANFCINQIRKASNKIKWMDIEDAGLEYEADEVYEENDKIKMEKILEYMQEMPPGFRLVLNMYAVEGNTHAEIASALGVTESTSKTQLFKARRWLRNKMKGETGYEG